LLCLQAFGSPTIIAHGKKPVMLFGSDRFPILAQVLGKYMVAVDLTLHN